MSDWEGFGESAGEQDQLQRLKAQLARVSQQLYDTKHRHADYIAAVQEAARDAVLGQSLRPVTGPRSRRLGKGPEEMAVALLSDMQTGKVTPDYNSAVAAERVHRYAEEVVKTIEVQRADHPVREVHVALLGDIVEGVDIFPGQQWLLDSTLYRQLLDTSPVIVVDFVRYLLRHVDKVVVWMVDGNHGRIGRKGVFGPEDNADRMVYRIVQLMLRDEPRVEFHQADPEGERAWWLIAEIGNYRALMIHGDQIRGAMGYPFYGLGKRVHAWASGGLGRGVEFDDVFLGHWHQLARIPLNHRTVWQNGSTESTNTFASEMLAAQSEPSQWLLFVDPDKGRVNASYGVDLR